MPFSLSPGFKQSLPFKSALIMSGAILLLSTVSFSANAQRGPHPDGGPPAEAFIACSTLKSDAVCSVETPHGKLPGTCNTARQSSKLVCVPEGHEGRNSGNTDRLERGGIPQGEEQGSPGRQAMREHTVIKSSGVTNLKTATQPPITANEYNSDISGEWRIITANSIAKHKTGTFPNDGNPNTISEQSMQVRVPANPKLTPTAQRVKVPGYALNGVEFDPGAGEFYKGDPASGWQYEALSGAVPLGIDENHAHVQPQGKYHYHGLPTLFLKAQNLSPDKHSPQIGWAVDGFPIYALYGHENMNSDSGVTELKSSYHLKAGNRPSDNGQPGGTYDGTFTADYEYIPEHGDLDECNGRMTVTPDFPDGTYAYFLTQSFPVVPRCVMGTPDQASQRSRR